MNVRAMERGDGRCVGNCLDRGRVGIVDDDRGILVQAQATGILQHLQPKCEITITHNTVAMERGASRNGPVMPDARDDIITTAAAVGISTLRNTVYNLLTSLQL
uniref:Uncharacterized protein n=1 Tax=Pseudo-nitzschia australis TaxID=44445 RepID=A0A7S4AKS6_9STRA